MKKVSIVYWSSGGNVEVLAENIKAGAEGLGAEVLIKHVHYAKAEDITKADAVAFGSPSMDNNKIEQEEMATFLKNFKELNMENKPTVLFGSYGWDEGQFMVDWEKLMIEYGFNIVGKLAVQEAPKEEEIKKAKALGELLGK
ncbi:flavodoxin [uncultured Clostridium sp.]|uniref:flavodoxin n=1 Tax=uncultured Clostridium sp. TaxID=59620 RepID=UPI0028E1F108|nr:flavodoxin [uncultured Clostridium sp.]